MCYKRERDEKDRGAMQKKRGAIHITSFTKEGDTEREVRPGVREVFYITCVIKERRQ